MATNNQMAGEVIQKLENCLKDLKIKSETQSNKDQSIIYGKFSLDKEHYQLVIHIRKEDFVPVTKAGGGAEIKSGEADDEGITPNLNFQSMASRVKAYSEEDGLKIKNQFLEKAKERLSKLDY